MSALERDGAANKGTDAAVRGTRTATVEMGTAAEAARYFRERPGFYRLLRGLRQRYESLGRFGGGVTLGNLDGEEQETLSGFFGKSYYGRKTAKISVAAFEKARAETRYGDCELKELLEAYFREKLVWKQEQLEDYRARRREFFDSICRIVWDTPAGRWISGVCETQAAPWPLLRTAYAANPAALKRELTLTLQALNALPSGPEDGVMRDGARRNGEKEGGRIVRLAAFSAEVSGDPHFFDEGGAPYRLLIAGIAGMKGTAVPETAENMDCDRETGHTGDKTSARTSVEAEPEPTGARERIGLLLFSAGLMKDDVSNSVATFGLTAPHAGLTGFFNLREPVVLTMMNLGGLTAVRAVDDRVFVLENPTVFAELAASDTAEERPAFSLICSCGQPKLAVLVLLDRLAAAGTKIYYSGDFDPEGLLIAEKLIKRYGRRLILWHYSKEDYEASKSEKPVSEVRMKQLELLTDPQLISVAELLRGTGLAGYQERLIDRMVKELRPASGHKVGQF